MVQLGVSKNTVLCNRTRIAHAAIHGAPETHLQLNDHRGTFPNPEVLAITF